MNPDKKHPAGSPPLGGILDRYLMQEFLKIFGISLLGVTILYLIVDFFDRIDNFLRSDASFSILIQYFLYKLPLLASRTFGFAALFAALFSLGMLSRNHEITAMRSSGISLRRLSLPLFLLSLGICVSTFFWNEALVPIFTRKAETIYKTEVKKKQPQSVIGTRDIWLRGEASFIRVDHFDAKRNLLEGVSIYLVGRDFTLRGVIEAPWARWNGTGWETRSGTEWLFLPDGEMTRRPAKSPLPLEQTPEDFSVLAQEPEELSFFDLRKKIADLKPKGIDTTEYEVDLQLKLSLPWISPLMVLLAVPFALRHGPGGGLALSFGLTLLIGLGYWFFLAFSRSLGHSEALSPWVAAWLPNLTLALVAIFFSLSEE